MTMTQQNNTRRGPDPFDGSADARLCRMGLLTESGGVNEAAMDVFAHIFAASLFDGLCDAYEDQRQISQVMSAFRELAANQDAKRMFLMISLQYDALRKPLPDPIWWLAGNVPALTRFSLDFAAYLLRLAEDMEKNEKEDDPSEIVDRCSQ